MRSPGCRADSETCRVLDHMAAEECGRLRPACFQAHITRPEQSHVFGPAAAHTYVEPLLLRAAAMAVWAPGVPEPWPGSTGAVTTGPVGLFGWVGVPVVETRLAAGAAA